MRFAFSPRRKVKREQRAFVSAAFAHLPDHVEARLRALPVTVSFKSWDRPGYRQSGIYDPDTKTLHIPPTYWKDQQNLARWIRELNEATFLHEAFHAFDFTALEVGQRDALLLPFTGYETNGHGVAYGVQYPKATDSSGTLLATWMTPDWGKSGAELFADVGVAAFTDLPPHDRAPEALQITAEAKAAVASLLAA